MTSLTKFPVIESRIEVFQADETNYMWEQRASFQDHLVSNTRMILIICLIYLYPVRSAFGSGSAILSGSKNRRRTGAGGLPGPATLLPADAALPDPRDRDSLRRCVPLPAGAVIPRGGHISDARGAE